MRYFPLAAHVFIIVLGSLSHGIVFGQKERVVVIDAGHGGAYEKGRTDGSQKGDGSSWNNAVSAKQKIKEKDLTLEYALEASRAFAASARARKLKIRCLQTRTDDRHLSALLRAGYAVQASADVFISIHFNASPSHEAEGTRAYICSEQHPEWEYMHFVNPYVKQDREFAQRLIDHVAKSLAPFGGNPEKRGVNGDRRGDGGHLRDGLRVLGFARQDTHLYGSVLCLLEVEFIDNPKVEAWLLDPRQRDAVRKAFARALVDAVCEHFERGKVASAPLKAKRE